MKMLLFSLDYFLYNINQKTYDWLHNEFDLYVGTYRLIFLLISNACYIIADFQWWIRTGSNFPLYLGLFVFCALFPRMKNHLLRENELQRKGKYVELNTLAHVCHSFDKHFYLRCAMNILTFVFVIEILFVSIKPDFVVAAFIVGTIWSYSIMVLVRPRNPHKRTNTNAKFAFNGAEQ